MSSPLEVYWISDLLFDALFGHKLSAILYAAAGSPGGLWIYLLYLVPQLVLLLTTLLSLRGVFTRGKN
ncbi:MAG: hypothetical protein P8K66_06015 [Planctomycetota bacterium]|nr:hypothetical protein [Planctomycetota bacterium]